MATRGARDNAAPEILLGLSIHADPVGGAGAPDLRMRMSLIPLLLFDV